MKRAFGLCLLGAIAVLSSQACGSDDPKKNDPNKFNPNDGGEGGGDGSGDGGTTNSGATAGSSGSGVGATSGEGTGGDPGGPGGGGPSMTGDGGTAMTGDGGASGSPGGDGCEPGLGNCDTDPDCEQNFNLVTSCGACNTTCNSTQASVACEDETCVIKSCNNGYGDCVNGADDGCESALNTDDHCGDCNRDCAAVGSTCSTNKCNEIPLQQGQPIGSDSGVNRTWAFSPDGLLHVGFNSYAVRRFPLDGAATQIVWDSTNKTAGRESLLVVGDRVYWSELGTGGNDLTSAVFSKKITDPAGTAPELAWVPEWHVQFLRLQGNAFYWMSGDYQSGDPGAWVYTRSVNATLADHGTRIMSVDQQTHNGIVAFNVTSDAIYWITAQVGTGTAYELRTTPLAGGTPTVVPSAPGASTSAVTNGGGGPELRVVGTTLYFNRDANDALDGMYSFNKGDTEPTWLVHAGDIRSFFVDDDFIYYHQQNVAGIWKAPIAGGAGVLISDDNASRLVGQDDQFIYAISSGCCSGDIYKVIK